jgi:hypothetical protein
VRRLIYVRESYEYVGPFASRGDAERFLILMTSFGESLEGIEIVEFDSDANSLPNAVSIEERNRVLDKVKRSQQLRREKL